MQPKITDMLKRKAEYELVNEQIAKKIKRDWNIYQSHKDVSIDYEKNQIIYKGQVDPISSQFQRNNTLTLSTDIYNNQFIVIEVVDLQVYYVCIPEQQELKLIKVIKNGSYIRFASFSQVPEFIFMAGGILEKHAHILSKIRITDGMIYPLGNNDIPNTKTKLLPTIKYYKNHLYILGGLNVQGKLDNTVQQYDLQEGGKLSYSTYLCNQSSNARKLFNLIQNDKVYEVGSLKDIYDVADNEINPEYDALTYDFEENDKTDFTFKPSIQYLSFNTSIDLEQCYELQGTPKEIENTVCLFYQMLNTNTQNINFEQLEGDWLLVGIKFGLPGNKYTFTAEVLKNIGEVVHNQQLNSIQITSILDKKATRIHFNKRGDIAME